MASYDLRCGECGSEFEVFVQGFLKDEVKVCPECGSRSVEQRFTGFLVAAGSRAAESSSAGGHNCSPRGGFG